MPSIEKKKNPREKWFHRIPKSLQFLINSESHCGTKRPKPD